MYVNAVAGLSTFKYFHRCFCLEAEELSATAAMDLVAGAGGMFGQLAVGIAGGSPSAAMPGVDSMTKLAKVGAKATIDSLPDKVRSNDLRKCQA